MSAVKKGGLGKGLGALIAEAVPVSQEAEEINLSNDELDKVLYIDIHQIMPNANQPRKVFDEEKINDLANSIKEHGIIQPIVVRKKTNGYEIVAGERRWRASMKAELPKVPCIIKELDDKQNMLFAIIENMQREDLNPIEEAEGINQMVEIYGLTQDEVSKSVGKSRPYITNSLRLLKLPDEVKTKVSEGKISAAHGRTLAAISDKIRIIELCNQIEREGLSVRETEKLVSNATVKKKKNKQVNKNPDVARVEEELKEILGTKVNIIGRGKKGKVEIEYYCRDELERIIELLKSHG